MLVGTVRELWRYPVKSMGGEPVSGVAVVARGLDGDRIYALQDRATGKIASAKHPRRWSSLLGCRAALDGQRVRITLPDGRSVVAGSPEADDALTTLLGRLVTLADAPPPDAETERDYRDVDGPLSGQFFSAQFGAGAPPGTFFDYAPIHLVTTASLDHLRALAPGSDFDARRYRPNLLIQPSEMADRFVENDWLGQTILVGRSLRLRVVQPTPRCVIPSLAHGDLPRDPAVLRAVAVHAQTPVPLFDGALWPTVGVYAIVEQPGPVRVGDDIRLLAGISRASN